MTKYKLKPCAEFEAVQWQDTNKSWTLISMMLDNDSKWHTSSSVAGAFRIETPQGISLVKKGDWVARLPNGEFRQIDGEEFARTYEEAE
jgi:hypothetical protein